MHPDPAPRPGWTCQAGDPSLWTGRTDPEDGGAERRWHQVVRCIDLPHAPARGRGPALIGFASDEGVRRNGGRTGAAGGPDAIRRACAPLPWHGSKGMSLLDVGDVRCDGGLAEAQSAFANGVRALLQAGYFPIGIGGGHEIAFGSFLGIASWWQEHSAARALGILNLDPHFDLRPPSPEISSGTPFRQMWDWCRERNRPFHYLCAGVEPYANTRSLFHTARECGCQWITGDELREPGQPGARATLRKWLSQIDGLYLSIDLDLFAAPFAPGVSAPALIGQLPAHVLPLLDLAASSGKLVGMDIAELNPRFDSDQRTARLAAGLISRLADQPGRLSCTLAG